MAEGLSRNRTQAHPLAEVPVETRQVELTCRVGLPKQQCFRSSSYLQCMGFGGNFHDKDKVFH